MASTISKKIGKLVEWVFAVLGALAPLFLLFFLASSGHTVFYEYGYKVLLRPQPEDVLGLGSGYRPAGFAILALLGVFKLNWVSCWVMALYITFFRDREYRSPTKGQFIMQAGSVHETGMVTRWNADGRLRRCPTCDTPSGDRVFHDQDTGRCLPLMDHYCFWLQVCVYSRTMKPYLYLILFLMLDALTTLGVVIWALSVSSLARTNGFFVSLLCVLVIIAVGNGREGTAQWRHLAFNNEVYFEYRHEPRKPVLLAFKDSRGGKHVARIQILHGNPWDLGWKENLRQVLGSSLWMWAFFFIQPERVQRYGRYPGSDLPYNENVWKLRRKLLDNPLGDTEFDLALLTTASARAQRMVESTFDYSVSSLEEVPEPRRRQNRTL